MLTGQETSLVGRGEELSRLRELVAPPYEDSRALLILGDPGMGKTVVLAAAAGAARRAGMRVLAAAGRESEQDLAFAGLHQLLRPVLDRVDGLPARQADALRGAFAISEDPVPPDALLTGIAVLTLLSVLSDDGPLLVTADDAQWLDRASLDALAFAARRLESEQLVLLIGARGNAPPAGFERDFPQLLLAPLPLPEAGRLLDVQPHPPRGRPREQVLAQAAGNPLALIELAKMIAADPDAGHRWATEPLPLTGQLTAIMTTRYAALPGTARAALLLAAAADAPDLTAATLPGLSAGALAPAEAAGLIRLDTSGPQFTHPLVRSAVYHAVPFAERAAAHLKVADALRDSPDRYAWHLAAAALEPDEHVARLLEDSAAQAQRRGGAAAAARALERAAELSPGERDKARRLLAAADLALPTGQADWVRHLAGQVLALTSDPDLRTAARLDIGWSLLWSNRNADALETLICVAAEASERRPALAWHATGLAATVAHQTGLPEACAKARAALDSLGDPAHDGPAGSADENRIWITACTDPFGARAETVPDLHRIAGGSLCDRGKVGGTAWILDETELAVRVLREALSQLRAPGVRGASGAVLSVLEWACIDSGRWDEALAAAREANDIAAAYKMETVAGSADLTTATVAAMRGDHDLVAPLLARVLAAVDTSEYRGFAARARHAAGLAALTQGHYVTAYAQLSQLVAADGTPLHHHFSYLAVADLAAAAARADRRLEARTLVERALALLDPEPGPRLTQLAARARGLLAEPDRAGPHFAASLSDPAGDSWPFERAQLQLDYGEWLRRQRRINDAKPVLGAALETFRRLGAAPWTRRAEAELRACGVAAQTPPAAPGGLDGLTAQQREIAVLAGRGLTNGEIADRMFLSPRTVASHLHRSYPKLGIAGRHQLRDLIDQSTRGGLFVTGQPNPVEDAADHVRPRPGTADQSGRRTLPRTATFWILAGVFLMLFFGSAAASPLYRVYQARFHFSAATLTAVFAAYVLVLLVTLLVFGSVSDYLGRLPVIITALVFSVAACAVFLAARGVGALYAARSLQGVATGLASGAIGAALIDLQPPGSRRAPVVTSVFSSFGLGLGGLVTSALVQYAPAPTRLIWWALLAVFAAGIVAVLAMAEPGSRRPGVLASLRPRVAVPRQARRAFAAAVPCMVAGWALGGLYLSLGPSLAAQATGSQNLLWGGLVIFLLCGTGAAAALAVRTVSPRATMLAGCLFLLAGMAVTFGAIAATASAAFLVGTALAGVGFGLAFVGSFRVTTALAEPDDRAGLVTAVYIVGYLAFSVPALIAGVATTKFGLHSTALVYSASLAVLAVAAIGLLSLRRTA